MAVAVSKAVAGWERLDAAEVVLSDDLGAVNAPVITAIFAVEGTVTEDWVLRNIAERLAAHPRFCSTIHESSSSSAAASSLAFGLGKYVSTPPQFVRKRNFNPAEHITLHREYLTDEALNRILSTPLGCDRPYWRLHVYAPPGGTSTDIIFRVNHVIGDGVSIAKYFVDNIVDNPHSRTHNHNTSSNGMPLKYGSKMHDRVPRMNPGLGVSKPSRALPARRKLHRHLAALGVRTTKLDGFTRPLRDAVAAMLQPLRPDSSSTLTRCDLRPEKRATWARARNVTALRAAARRAGVTLNDMLLAALAGAVRTHFVARGERIPARTTLALPVNQHPPTGVGLWNAVTALLLALPVRAARRHARLASCVRSMRDMKAGYRAPLMRVIVHALAALPRSIRIPIWRHVSRAASVAFTNVPGPPVDVTCAGRRVRGIRVLAGGAARCGVMLTAFSYDDQLQLGMWSDPGRLEDPQTFLDAFDYELDALLAWASEEPDKPQCDS